MPTEASHAQAGGVREAEEWVRLTLPRDIYAKHTKLRVVVARKKTTLILPTPKSHPHPPLFGTPGSSSIWLLLSGPHKAIDQRPQEEP